MSGRLTQGRLNVDAPDPIRFTKLHGALNDYVFLDAVTVKRPRDPGALARKISSRRAGVGSDGLILLTPSELGVCKMEMYNSDGTPGEMCGNGLRCVAKMAFDAGWTDGRREFEVESAVGLHPARILRSDGPSDWIEVGLGSPRWEAHEVPVIPDVVERTAQVHFEFEGARYVGHALSFGNPHVVFELTQASPDQLAAFPLERFGPLVENAERFPERVNVEVVVWSNDVAHQRTWERGSGETWACGSGACAVASVAVRLGRPSGPVTVRLRGGTLEIQPGEQTLLRGPATEAFRGEWRAWEA